MGLPKGVKIIYMGKGPRYGTLNQLLLCNNTYRIINNTVVDSQEFKESGRRGTGLRGPGNKTSGSFILFEHLMFQRA